MITTGFCHQLRQEDPAAGCDDELESTGRCDLYHRSDDRPVYLQMMCFDPYLALPLKQVIQLVQHAYSAAGSSSHGSAGQPKGRDRPKASDKQRAQNDVADVSQPQADRKSVV